jgi:DNA invertase Pin-like site-specific DNA recombinase
MLANPYLRFSHADQQLGSSIPRQRSLAADMIAPRGWLLGEEYVDDGKSASKGRHRAEGAELYRFEK